MRIWDLIEGLSSKVYHYTSIYAAAKILKQGVFELSSTIGSIEEQYAPPGYPYFLSTTRTLTGGYHSTLGSQAVMFNLDGNWYNQRYKAGPVDYWGDRGLGSNYAGRASEAEDRLYSKTPTIPITGVTGVHVYMEPMDKEQRVNWGSNFPAQARKVLIAAKQRGIPVHLYEDKEAWRRQDIKQAVPISQERETLKGIEKTGRGSSRTTSWLEPWIELIYKNKTAELSKKAKDFAYSLAHDNDYYLNSLIGSLKNDFANARKPSAGADRPAAVKIISWMTQNKLNNLNEFIAALQKKWQEIKQKEMIKEEYLGNCVNSFDRDGECTVVDLPYTDATEFAQAEDRAIEVSEMEFNHNFNIPIGIKQKLDAHEVKYLYDERNDVYMVYDLDDDVHYFFR